MKIILSIVSVLALGSACAKAPSKPLDSGKVQQAVGQNTANAEAGDEHADHDEMMQDSKAGTEAAPLSARAEDLELLNAWPKAQYLGNEQLKLSFVPAVPLN